MSTQPAELRRRRRHSEARRAILDAASAILIEAGYERFTMRRLANRCGYTAPTIYHHFGDKEGLIDALLEEVFRELVAELKHVSLGPDALENMRAQFSAFVQFALSNPTHYRLLTTPRAGDQEPPPSGEEAIALLEGPLQALVDAGRLREPLEAVQQSLWALLHGVISLQTSRPDYEWAPSLVPTALEAMIEGLILPEPSQNRIARTTEEKRA